MLIDMSLNPGSSAHTIIMLISATGGRSWKSNYHHGEEISAAENPVPN